MDKRGKNVGQSRLYRGKRLLPGGSVSSGQPYAVSAQKSASDSKSSDSGGAGISVNSQIAVVDMSVKIPLCAWHPMESTYAVAKHNSLFLYT
jgi:hypothetical protein